MRLLSSGVDTLNWSARASADDLVAELLPKKLEAAAVGEKVPWREVRGFALSVGPSGAQRYPAYVECPEFRLKVTASEKIPTFYAELRSPFIHEVGVEAAHAESRAVARELAGVDLSESHMARMDLYADFADWRLQHADREGVTTHAKLAAHFRAGTEDVETIAAGKAPQMLRLYRKDIECQTKGGHAPVFWPDWHGEPVTRVEVEAWGKHLARFGLRTVDEALASRGDVWRHATSKFFQMRIPGPGPKEAWPLRPEWEAVQAVGIGFPASGVVPFVVAKGDVKRIEDALYGYLTRYGGYEGITEPHALLRHLEARLPEIARGRVFAAEVERKRALYLPRAIRRVA